jgi:hypothetical protein
VQHIHSEAGNNSTEPELSRVNGIQYQLPFSQNLTTSSHHEPVKSSLHHHTYFSHLHVRGSGFSHAPSTGYNVSRPHIIPLDVIISTTLGDEHK